MPPSLISTYKASSVTETSCTPSNERISSTLWDNSAIPSLCINSSSTVSVTSVIYPATSSTSKEVRLCVTSKSSDASPAFSVTVALRSASSVFSLTDTVMLPLPALPEAGLTVHQSPEETSHRHQTPRCFDFCPPRQSHRRWAYPVQWGHPLRRNRSSRTRRAATLPTKQTS